MTVTTHIAPNAPSPLDDHPTFLREAAKLGAAIPGPYAAWLTDPAHSPDDKIAGVKSLILFNQSDMPLDTFASAPAPLREAAGALQALKTAALEQAKTIEAKPAITQPFGLTIGRLSFADMGTAPHAANYAPSSGAPTLSAPGQGKGGIA